MMIEVPFSSLQVVAIKQLNRDGLQGNREFLVEVLMLSLLHHQNLVNLIGYCADGDQRLLVYEYMHFGSLEDHLHGTNSMFIPCRDTVLHMTTTCKFSVNGFCVCTCNTVLCHMFPQVQIVHQRFYPCFSICALYVAELVSMIIVFQYRQMFMWWQTSISLLSPKNVTICINLLPVEVLTFCLFQGPKIGL